MNHIKYFDEYVFENYNEDLILERLDLNTLLNLFKNNKRYAKYLIAGLISLYSFTKAETIISNLDLNQNDKELLISELDSIKKNDFSIDSLKLSEDGWDFIRNEEQLRLKAYSIGDGKISVGYGHAQPINSSKFRLSQNITKEKAEQLLKRDVNIAAQGVKRIFKEWKKQNINIEINQHQYDALVSMAYNMGVNRLRNSDMMRALKEGNFNLASSLIKTTAIKKGFSGLIKRRQKEFELFTKTQAKQTKIFSWNKN